MRNLFFLLLLLNCSITLNAQDGRLIPSPLRKIPKWVRDEFFAKNFDQRYSLIFLRNPAYLKGDFNGDGRKDFAIQVEEKSSRKSGIAIFHAKAPQVISTTVTILGAGKSIGAGEDNFQSLDMWRLIAKHNPSDIKNMPELKGDAILINKRDAGGGLIYWDGKKYTWQKMPRTQH
jgi:hypothetical protein